jgi:hypothetical protein
MAFIRWKPGPSGNHKAYLIQSYRDESGKPKHKMLAYLGDETSLTPERLAALKTQYPDLKVDWDKIKPVARPKTDISSLSDADLIRKMRALRHELHLDQNRMFWLLEKFGLPRCTSKMKEGMGVGGRNWGVLEKALENDEPQDFYADPLVDIAPALRKAYLSKM